MKHDNRISPAFSDSELWNLATRTSRTNFTTMAETVIRLLPEKFHGVLNEMHREMVVAESLTEVDTAYKKATRQVADMIDADYPGQYGGKACPFCAMLCEDGRLGDGRLNEFTYLELHFEHHRCSLLDVVLTLMRYRICEAEAHRRVNEREVGRT